MRARTPGLGRRHSGPALGVDLGSSSCLSCTPSRHNTYHRHFQAPELLDASSFGHGPDSVDSADSLNSLALEALRRSAFLAVGLRRIGGSASSSHAPLLLASSLAPAHAPLLSGDVRLRREPGWDPFFLPTLRAIWAGKNCKEACMDTERAEIHHSKHRQCIGAQQSNNSEPRHVEALFLDPLTFGTPRRGPRFLPHALTPCARTAGPHALTPC